MIYLADNQHCTGCSACMQVCLHRAIQMQEDEEGFLYPKIDTNSCVECGLCMMCCPELHPIERLDYSYQKAYALINYADRKISSSGGAFSVFARWILEQGGVVFGATMDDKLLVKHIKVDSIVKLDLLRGSKYVQSQIGDCYLQAREELKRGKKVLFTGTGCQIAGLYAFLKGKRYEGQLITLDLVCHGVPSQEAFQSYLNKLEQKYCRVNKKISDFRFRKLDSWDYRPAIKFAKSKWHTLSLWENAYMSAFFRGIIYRESCFNCQYCNMQRIGTFTIADFWGIGKQGKPFSKNVSSGVSLVIDNVGLLMQIKDELLKDIYIEERSIEEAVASQTNLKSPVKRLPERDYAIKLLLDEHYSLKDFARKCGLPYKATLGWKLMNFFKNIVSVLGLYNVYKSFIYKVKR